MIPSRSASPLYPREHETDVALRDGSTVHVRPVRADDEPAIRTFLEAISEDSIGFRFFGTADLDWVTAWSIDVDYADRFALIAESGTPSRIIAHAAYIRINDQRAELAFLVADAWQGRGISSIMLAHLAVAAAQHGIATFIADVLPANHRMIDVFRQSGFPIHMQSGPDAIEIELPTSLSPDALARASTSANEPRRLPPSEASSPPDPSPLSVPPDGGNGRWRALAQPGRGRVHGHGLPGQRSR